MRFRRALVAAVAAVAGATDVAVAQYQTRAWLDWRTIQHGRFAIHFPSDLEAWARTVASRIGAIDTVVSDIAGHVSTRRVDVLVDDPFSSSNGSAWPLLDEPRLVLWATPPSPREDIGTYVSWADMIATHELAHLAHLLRPTRNTRQSLLWKLAPVELGPISRKAPRWLIEGYATYVEGRVTGSGRPNGVWRPTLLRQWALEGMLPTYAQLDNFGGMYGGDFAYLAGSSFIEWLTARRGDSSLVSLWRRLSATRDRGFADAFAGVYGENPDILYGRFAAELTAAAKVREAQTRRANSDTGETIQHLARETGDPAIARDGGRAAIMLASSTRPGRIVIWRTIPESDSAAIRADRALLARDPADVPPFRPFPPPKRALATLHAVGNQSYLDPRFFADGRVLVWRNTAVGDGSWRPDLYVWDPQRGTVKRLTRRANVRQGDPSPDGRTIAATQCAGGTCHLALVDATSGRVSIAARGTDRRSFHRPRFSPSGRAIVATVRHEGFWRIGLIDPANDSVRIITTGARDVLDPSFVDDTTLVASAEENGILNVVTFHVDGRLIGKLTNVTGAAVAPEVNPADGSIWFLALHARGWDVRATRTLGAPALEDDSSRPVPKAPAPNYPFEPRDYSPDRKWIYFPAGNVVRNGAAVGFGIVNTDPVGRHELIIQGAKSISPQSVDAPLEGGVVTLTRRTRSPWTFAGFAVRQDGPFWYSLRGVSLSNEASVRREVFSRRAVGGGTWAMARSPLDDPAGSARWLVFGEVGGSVSRFHDGRRTSLGLTVHVVEGRRDSEAFDRAVASVSLASTEIPVSASAQLGFVGGAVQSEWFSLGGNPPTMLPPGVVSQYIAQPALPPFFTGDRLESYRLSIPVAGARLYGWAGRAYAGEAPPLERVLGAEWSASIAAIPVLGTPAARATVGVGHWLDRRTVLRQSPDSPVVFTAPRGKLSFYLTTQFGDWAR